MDYGLTINDITKYYCPLCSGTISLVNGVDPWIQKIQCSSGHKLFIELKLALFKSCNSAQQIKLPTNLTENEVIQAWFNNPNYREKLNPQIAEILRRISEHSLLDFESNQPDFGFCPLCSEVLINYDNGDAWTKGLRCKNNHNWAERTGGLSTIDADRQIHLHKEISSAIIKGLLEGWLIRHVNSRWTAPQLHPAVKRIFANTFAQLG